MLKPLRTVVLLSALWAITGVAPVHSPRVMGQEDFEDLDLFDESASVEDAGPAAVDPLPTPASPPVASPTVDVSAVIDAIRESDPQTPHELFRAVDQLIRLEQAAVAAEYLDRLAKLSLDDTTLAQLFEQFGTAAMIRLARTAELSPQANDFARSVMAAGRRVLEDPTRLDSWVVALNGGNDAERFHAAKQLLRAGPNSVAPLVESITARDDPDSPANRWSWGVLRRLGSAALEPLHAYLAATDAPARGTAITALGLMGSTESLPFLVAPLWVPGDDLGEGQRAAAAWRRILGRVPGQQEAIELLSLEADRAYQGHAGLVPDPDDLVTRWTWDAERKRPVATRMRTQEAAAVKASRLYEDMLRVNPADAQAIERYLISRLAVDQALGGLDQPLRRGAGTAFDSARRAGSGWVNRVLRRAIADRRDAAAIGAAEVLGSLADASVLQRSGLELGDESVPLVDALSHANRRVRFAAAQAMMKLQPEGPFHGAGRLADVLEYFATSNGSRAAVVAHPNLTTAQTLAGLLTARGFQSVAVSTARDLEAAATSSADVELVMVSDSLNDASLWSTLEALRVHPRTARVPIAILARPTSRDAALLVADGHERTIVVNETADEAAIALQLPQLLQLADRDAIGPQRRLEQAQLAKKMLDHVQRSVRE